MGKEDTHRIVIPELIRSARVAPELALVLAVRASAPIRFAQNSALLDLDPTAHGNAIDCAQKAQSNAPLYLIFVVIVLAEAATEATMDATVCIAGI